MPMNYLNQVLDTARKWKEMEEVFDSLTTIPMAIFNLSSVMGPEVFYHDFNQSIHNHPIDSSELTTYLGQMAVTTMTAIGIGHLYREGCFDLHAGGMDGYRSFIVSIIQNKNGIEFDHNKYLHIVLFLPVEFCKALPSVAFLEKELLYICKKNLRTQNDLKIQNYITMKNQMLMYLISNSNLRNHAEMEFYELDYHVGSLTSRGYS